jgi:hypothetical protein
MADAYKLLYQGQLPSTVATLATVGASKSWVIGHYVIRNPTGGAVSYELFRNGTTGPYSIDSGTIPAGGKAEWDGKISMATGEYIAGVASSATSLTMTMDGDEVS